ncbi:substrate-binding domain-containing protein [Lichenicoccus sp.]|uniref:substrate-binding domain-containing protein n=1 Tax=Lichenicoccus sp. TaxID=2781899 RepID=UPI003D0F0373
MPVVMIGRHLPGLPVHSVRGDAAEAGRLAAELMLQGGGRRFGIITGPDELSTILERQNAIQVLLEQAGLAPSMIQDGHLTSDGGYNAALDIMRRPTPPDSLLCLTDVMALGAMDAIRHRLGMRVPQDVAVIGFDDIAEVGHSVGSAYPSGLLISSVTHSSSRLRDGAKIISFPTDTNP